MSGSDATEVTERGITMTRLLDAPRDAVFREWTDPARFAGWFGSPNGTVPVETAAMDVRPGGTWRVVMLVGPDREEMPFGGEYQEVVAPERLVMTLRDPADPTGPNADVLTVDLTERDGGTEMAFSQTGGHLDVQEYGNAARGWSGFFEQLGRQVST